MRTGTAPRTFQELIFALQRYWSERGCVVLQPYDMEVGAGTFHTATFLRSIGPEPWSAAYLQPSRRPADGRYGDNPFRLQHYYQFQVVMKPSPLDILDQYLGSLRALGFDLLVHDVRFVEDNWESPTLGAWGLGWEVWLNGMEITQFTYFQQIGGLECRPVTGEITYGLERLAMYLQGVESIYDIVWTDGPLGRLTYRDVFHQNEVEQSGYNFEGAEVATLFRHFDDHERACKALLERGLALPAYEQVLKASHSFNLLDARRAISVTERQRYILRIRALASEVARTYYASREALGFPLARRGSPAGEVGSAPRRARPSYELESRELSVGSDGQERLPLKRDFLVEIGTEELPPKTLRQLEQAFASNLAAGLDRSSLKHGEVQSFATPRRLAVLIRHVAARQPDQKIERRGPPVNAAFDAEGLPTRAAQAFATSCMVSVEDLQRREEKKGAFLYHVGTWPGAPAVELLPTLVRRALDTLPIPRSMRWGEEEARFVRPVRWIAMLYGKEILPATLFDAASGNLTHGHRFHAPKPLRLTSAPAYERALRERGHVIADFQTRRSLVREGVTAVAAGLGGRALIGAALLDEVTALVEWPVPLAGRFDERFLSLPREVLISTLEDHQRYFPVEGADGRLLPCFIAVANIESRDPAKVVEGNQRVVRPRLADAAFFWEQDRKAPLATHIEALTKVTFQAKLGSLGDKARRVGLLAADIAAGGRPPETAESSLVTHTRRAAELCKCDLLTAMVGEFPELQGIMGTYYALADGEEPEVATAIREHYQPRSAGDALPATEMGTTLAIADRLDTLAGIFAIGEKPSGTKDPFGLRRAAIGVVRILIEKQLELDVARLLDRAVQLVRADIEKTAAIAGKAATPATASVAAEVYDYVLERLRAYYLENTDGTRDTPVTTEMFDAVLAARPVSPLDFDARLRALSAFLALPEAASLTAANKRVANILRKSGTSVPSDVDAGALQAAAERQLFEALRERRDGVSAATARKDYASSLTLLAQLRPAVDAFFDQVMVMDENPKLRANRLALLTQMRELFADVADLSRLPG